LAIPSKVAADVFRLFLSLLKWKSVDLTNENNFGGAREQDLAGGLFMR
jgi:hypothetical protein